MKKNQTTSYKPGKTQEKTVFDCLKAAYQNKYQASNRLLDLFNCYELAVIAISAEIAARSENEKICLEHWAADRPLTFGGSLHRLNLILEFEEAQWVVLINKQPLKLVRLFLELREDIQSFSFSSDFNLKHDFPLSELFTHLFHPIVQLRNIYVHDGIEEVTELKKVLERLFIAIMSVCKKVFDSLEKETPFITQKSGFRYYLTNSKKMKWRGSKMQTVKLKKEINVTSSHFSRPQRIIKTQIEDIELVRIPSGSIMLKTYDEDKPAEHFISSFYLATLPVSLKQFQFFLDENPIYAAKRMKDKMFLKGLRNLSGAKAEYMNDSAVFFVTWRDALEYCNWLSQKHGWVISYGDQMTVSKQGFRLPTEYEWYYAATCGLGKKAQLPNKEDVVYRDNRGKYKQTIQNKDLYENDWGLAGMLGNINEWTNSLSKRRVLKKFERWKASDAKKEDRVVIVGGSFASPWRLINYEYHTDVSLDNPHYIGIRVAIDEVERFF